MFRKALLPAVAIALLSGCATDYSYRNGNGDYYYGRPQVEYRYIGGYGSYGGNYGGYGYGLGYGSPVYYYDRYGRLVYGQPYGYYGTPYSGGHVPYRPRRPSHGDNHHGDDNDGTDRRPPWRNIGRMRPGTPDGRAEAGDDTRPRRQPAPFIQSAPRPERLSAPSVETRSGGGSPRAKAIRALGE